MRFANSLIHILAGAALFLGVVAMGGRPGAFPDTAFYYSQGEYLAAGLGLVDAREAALSPTDPTSVLANARQPGPTPLDTVLGARPPLYGLLLYAAGRHGGLWAMAAIQALIAATALWITAQTVLDRRRPAGFYCLIVGLALTSSLPFVAAFAMPDLFAGLSVLSIALLLLYPDRLSRPHKALLMAMLCFGVACHPAHLVDVGALLAVAVFAVWRGAAPKAGVSTAIAAVVAGGVLAALAAWAATAPDHPQTSPPFLTARIVADGPGRLYLQAACSRGQAYALCAYRHEPLATSEDILWSTTPEEGVFARADIGTRRALQAEQLRFVAGALAVHPLGELGAASANFARQLLSFSVDDELRNASDFFRQPYLARTRLVTLIPNMAGCRLPLKACANRLPYDWLRIVQQTSVLMSLGLIAWRFTRPGYFQRPLTLRVDSADRLIWLAGLVLAAIVINAAACGVLSAPFPRYGARLIWLVPLIAGLMLLQARERMDDAAQPVSNAP